MMIPNSGLLRLTSILLVVIALSTGGSAQKTKTDIRLPGSIKPKHYDISIIPDLEANDMEGTASMEFSVDNSTDEIVMHGMNLTVDEESVILITLPSTKTTKAKDGHQVKAVSVSYDTSKDFIIIKLDSKLDPSFDYRVSLSYSGALSSNLKGLYRSSYFDQATQSNKWLAVTQFEPVAARLAFPCMDEPAMKATFTMSLGRRSDYTSLSNMPLIRSEPIAGKPGWFLDIFDRSVPMSTYLVAILISPFRFRQAKTVIRPSITDNNVSDSTEVRIWARPDAINETDLAVEVTPTMLEFLENYFQVHFPLPKVDLVGLPDFSSGAMENWGLITYRETTLLIDPVAPAVWDEMNVERVIAHELAHQWFGNLVTMEWWNDLWLNEGFATYVQRLVLDGVSPKYEYGTQQALNFLSVMEADALTTSHPISVNVENPTQISEIFDAISYTKGSAVIRMMNHFLGEKTFRQGVTNYLNEKKYLNARQDELWQFLTEQARADRVLPTDVDVKTIMDTWTLQMGFPLITIIRNYTQGTAHIQQERFLRGQSDEEKIKFVSREKSSSTPNYQWWVPISFTNAGAPNFSEKNTKPLLWLSPKKLSSTVRFRTNANNWVLANVLATGFYRVNYDDNNWRLLDEQLKTDHNVIHPINRAYLIDDIFALAATKTVSYATAFSLIEYLSKEEHYVPWSSALRSLAYIGRMFSHTAHHNRYKAFVLSIITPAYIRLGTEFSPDDSPLTKLSRISIISQACNQEYRPCIKRAQDLFDEWMNSSDPLQFKGILPDLRSSIYCTAIKYGTIKEWEFAWEMSQKVISAQVRDELLGALGCSREPSTLIRYLSFVLDPTSGVRKQDGRRVVNAVSGNSAGRLIAINYIMKNFDKLFHYFGNPVRVLQMLRSATANLNTPDDLTMIKEFLASKATLLEEAQSSANNIQAAIGANIQWMEDNYDTVNAWFASKEF